MDEHNVVDPYSGVLFSYKWNGNLSKQGGNQDIMVSEMSQTQRDRSLGFHSALLCSSCCNKLSETWWFKPQAFISYRLGAENCIVKALADVVPGEGCFLSRGSSTTTSSSSKKILCMCVFCLLVCGTLCIPSGFGGQKRTGVTDSSEPCGQWGSNSAS